MVPAPATAPGPQGSTAGTGMVLDGSRSSGRCQCALTFSSAGERKEDEEPQPPEAPSAGKSRGSAAAAGGWAWGVVFHFFLVSGECAKPSWSWGRGKSPAWLRGQDRLSPPVPRHSPAPPFPMECHLQTSQGWTGGFPCQDKMTSPYSNPSPRGCQAPQGCPVPSARVVRWEPESSTHARVLSGRTRHLSTTQRH